MSWGVPGCHDANTHFTCSTSSHVNFSEFRELFQKIPKGANGHGLLSILFLVFKECTKPFFFIYLVRFRAKNYRITVKSDADLIIIVSPQINFWRVY